jgi:NAD(P)-dependent dehydrogenase (short-subunit alcohol dehydrogenase family)
MAHAAIAQGNVAVITGGASGIGLAAARRFGSAGMQVVLLDLPGSALDEVKAGLAADGVAVTALPTDVTDRAGIAAAKTQIDRLGSVSVLMCNAGREGGGGILADENVWRRTLETNLWGAIHCLQIFLPDMMAAWCCNSHRFKARHYLAARRCGLQCVEGCVEGARRIVVA